MFLKSLELHGFKSFADNTLFEFHDGVTGIVGPNGCGKSNVVDAIRWVLGESSAKALRGSEMADVIFNGTESRKALGLAEVTLTLSRCESVLGTDYHEVAIGRRVFRDGNSDYLLNGTVVRRKDIQNLLMDTGIGRTSYSIMEQGKIDMLLSSKPEDRRAVFEEAAGITKFKVQKKEALRKLDYTEANLVRVADIIAEVKRQMNSLQRQAAKARRFQSLLNDVKVLDTHFSHRQFQELQAEKAELETSISSLRKEQSELEEKIDRQQTRIGETRDHYQHLESEIGDTRQQIADQQARIQAATGRVNFNEERSRELKSLIDQNATDIQSTGSKLEQQELDLRSTDETLSEIEAKLQSQRHQLETAVSDNHQQREHLETLQQELDNTQQEGTRSESDLISIKAQLENLLAQSEADRTRRDQLTEELDLLRREHGSKREEFNRLQTGINEYQKTIEDSEQQLIIADKAAEAARRKLDDMRDHLRDIHRSLTQKQSRLQIIRQLIDQGEGFQKGTQAVMRHFDEPERFGHAVRGVLASFVEAEPDYAAAIEAALGRHLQTVLVSNSGAAEQIIDTLSERKLGEASLIVEEFIGAATHDLPRALPEGAVAWALDKTRVHQNFRGIVQKLLVNVLIVPNIRVALNLRNQLDPATSFATLNGELVSPLGIIEGGAGTEDKGAVLQRQSEVRQLESETTELQKEVTSHEEQVEALEMKLMHHEGNLEVDRERLQHTRLVHSTLDGKKNLLGREIQTLETKIESLEWEQAEVEKRAEASDANMSSLHEQQDAAALNLEQTRARINQLTDELKNTEKLAH
ncbi:MAG: chromosome segregation protein SMC, partial [Verrucomicrobiota bacterium]